MRHKVFTRYVSIIAIASGLTAASYANAQTIGPTVAETAPPDEADTGSITVTGTRIQRPDLTSNSPLTVVGEQEIKLQGATNVESVLNRLPQVTADANETVSNGSDGTARVNLRNLGSNRNLVLIDGQRLLPVQANDLNFIPSLLVERVDVVSGGASAVYGSDAISGVVNFVLKRNLNGIRADAQYGFAIHDNNNDAARQIVEDAGYSRAPRNVLDGQRLDLNLAAGKDFADGRGNITAYFGYRNVKPILQSDRDVSACAFDPNPENSALICGGSSNNQFGLFNPLTGPGAGRPSPFVNTKDGAKTWATYGPEYRYNTAPLNYFQRNDTRYTAGGFARFEIAPAAEVYASGMFMDDRTNSQVAPSALWQGDTYTINCNNPLMSAQQGQLLCGADYGTAATQDLFIGYRPVAGNARPRRDDLRHTDFRLSGGVRGQIAEGIRYDINALYSRVLFRETYQNDIDARLANRGLQVVDVNGTPTCTSVVDGTDPNCVPLDVFGYGAISQDAFDYIYVPSSTRGVDKEQVYSGNVSADLTSYGVVSPWATRGVGVVVGVEHRRESLVFRADDVAQSKGTTESQGKFNVSEIYGELEVPILEDLPFAKALTINGGYRLSDYSSQSKKISTYKFEVEYAPTSDLRFRGSYNRAIRAPNISELYAGQQVGNVSAQDPCSGPTPEASLEKCLASGVTREQYGSIPECPSEQCSALGGGNPNLRPEKGDTFTVGTVLTPNFLPRFSLSVDYFNIKVKDYISSVPTSLAISQCFATGDPYFCGLFNRDPRTGTIFGRQGYIVSTNLNTGSLKTSGFDIVGSYTLPTASAGTFALDMTGTLLDELVTEPLPGLGSYDCKGLFGPTCGQPTPAWRHQARLTWTDADKIGSISLNWRYIGKTKLSTNTDDPFLTSETYSSVNSSIRAYNYFDLAGTLKVEEGVTFRAGVNNLFDRDPPAIAQGNLYAFGNGNTYPGVYDVAGRTVFMGISANF
ncbi:TonB-dependent receptor domain-containing protein [Sphingomonas sp. ac-8]|uniref:TonB-dependent receptor domain-containing protein n=1 Tax=Sphingomonas sp. ac-8 TaxID=3242977 RepID=UPI003A808E48